ncbi:MAG: hypothetical protein A3K19_00900 [Lentisphaerae bacterium RIFOXYB12_FULL_65_16]|nr:MAG: hypothetical protein A3K18_20230 [Lentisphaerae bacterium RIFOXYA12_64_32]OGV84710.1 MAG: hypothetical protein A3K19_00900 [Lentisphaerae bacterium RIFOXYB12_FULL_65_16]
MEPLSEFWGSIWFGTEKIGHMHQRFDTVPGPDGHFASEWETVLGFKRGGELVEFHEHVRVGEDTAGLVRHYQYRLDSFSGGQLKTSAAVEGTADGERLRLHSAGYDSEVPLPAAARGPRAMLRRIVAERARGAGHSFSELVFAPELARGVVTRIEFGSVEDVELAAETRSLQRLTQTTEIRPLHPDLQWLDEQGRALLTRIEIPLLGPVRILRCSKEEALLPSTAVELMTSAMVAAPARIPAPRAVRRARYRLRCTPGAEARLCADALQQVTAIAAGQADVTVSTPPPDSWVAGYAVPFRNGAGLADYLRPTPFLEADQPLLQDMAREAAGEERNSVALARRLESYVRGKIVSKTLDMGFASALETARALRGDCSEHSVLVAALARALGIPSRLVVGLAYMSNVTFGERHETGAFVFHVWAELLVAPDVWLPVDPALGRFDATHIALTKSALATASPVADLCLPVLELVDSLTLDDMQVLDP